MSFRRSKIQRGLLPPPDEISPRLKQQLASRIHRWKMRDTWTLWEAGNIVFGVVPSRIVTQFHPRAPDADILRDYAIRAIQARKLVVGNPMAPPRRWWVIPEVFAEWVISRPDLVGTDRARIFDLSFRRPTPLIAIDYHQPPDPASSAPNRQRALPRDEELATRQELVRSKTYPPQKPLPSEGSEVQMEMSARERVLRSSFKTDELEAAFEAIAQFRLPAWETGRPPPNGKVVRHWLETKYGFTIAAQKRIDTLIRPKDYK